VSDVRLLGHGGKLNWARNEEGLTIQMPEQKPCEHAFAFKITGLKTVASADVSNLPWVPKAAAPQEEKSGAPKGGKTGRPKAGKTAAPKASKDSPTVEPLADGSLKLEADQAELHGSRIKVETRGGKPNIGFWDNPRDWASWNRVAFRKAGAYEVGALVASAKGESEFVVEIAGQQLIGKAPATGGWDKFQTAKLGKVEIKEPGEAIVKVRPRDPKTWKAINLACLTLKTLK
jgi:alpha-L-fucosidase